MSACLIFCVRKRNKTEGVCMESEEEEAIVSVALVSQTDYSSALSVYTAHLPPDLE